MKDLRFGLNEAQEAADDWGFNCGPAALCAVLGMTPDEIRPHLGDFERKGHTNPSLMAAILKRLEVPFGRRYQCLGGLEAVRPAYPNFGLVRIQWSGPWTRSGVPVKARYRHTHWIAVRESTNYRTALRGTTPRTTPRWVFDVNNIAWGGWIFWECWAKDLVPWLLERCEPKSDGRWWPTHCWEIGSRARRLL